MTADSATPSRTYLPPAFKRGTPVVTEIHNYGVGCTYVGTGTGPAGLVFDPRICTGW